MKTLHTTLATLLGATLVLSLGARPTTMPHENPGVALGTYDSRGVAFAYFGSSEFEEYLRAQHEDIQKAIDRARAAGDLALAQELDELGPAMQRRIHEQGFGSGPIDDILDRIADRLPAIALEAGVDVIVSKWDLDHVRPGAEIVDVTELLAAEFGPDEETLKAIREVMDTDPVPQDQLEHDH